MSQPATPQHTLQRLRDEQVQANLAAFWAVYDRVHEQVAAAAAGDLRDEPELTALLDTEVSDAQRYERSHRLLSRAFEDGDWEPYLAWLGELGVAYAQRGLSFEGWFRLVSVYRPHVVPELIAAYGDDADRLAAALRGMGTYFDVALQTIGDAYRGSREETIAKQQAAIVELSTPVLQIRDGLLLLPIVGVIDTQRSSQLTQSLLLAIRDKRARVVVMDITGVSEVDTEVANRLIQAAEAARLMGAEPILTGISAGVAQTLVSLGVDLKGLQTLGDLQGGMEQADAMLGIRVVSDRGAPVEGR